MGSVSIVVSDHDSNSAAYDSIAAADDELANSQSSSSSSSSDESAHGLLAVGSNGYSKVLGGLTVDSSRLLDPDDLEYFGYKGGLPSSGNNSSIEDDDGDDDDDDDDYSFSGRRHLLTDEGGDDDDYDDEDENAGYKKGAYSDDDEFYEEDPSHTVNCGYVVLFSTWFIFVCGIGSIFGVWRRVWAPVLDKVEGGLPSMDDDADLLIDEYYPSMVMLLCVVAWIWCVVSWVGMKLFRHAKGGVSSDTAGSISEASTEEGPTSPVQIRYSF